MFHPIRRKRSRKGRFLGSFMQGPVGEVTDFVLSLLFLCCNFILLLDCFLELYPFSITVVRTPYWFRLIDGLTTSLLGTSCLLKYAGFRESVRWHGRTLSFWYNTDLFIFCISFLPFFLYAYEPVLIMGVPSSSYIFLCLFLNDLFRILRFFYFVFRFYHFSQIYLQSDESKPFNRSKKSESSSSSPIRVPIWKQEEEEVNPFLKPYASCEHDSD